jgi:stearoyl-CoA desaturase (delta-9 desaturase)
VQPSALQKSIILGTVIVPLLGTLFAIRLLWQRAVGWPDVALLLALYAASGLGITAGFHRMLTHRSFVAHPIVKALFLILGSMAVEGPALGWAADHTRHHAYSDQEGDPHSPLVSFFHAHIGWMWDHTPSDPAIYCKHLLKDRLVMAISRTFVLWAALGLVLPAAIGGVLGGWRGALTGLVWGGLVRVFLTHHVTWSVNSICHTFGKRPFATTDRSRNEWLVGLLAFGEGWHNNHHAFPRSAFHGLRWWQFDGSGYLIWLLERVRLVRDVYRVSTEQQRRRQERTPVARALGALGERISPAPPIAAAPRP